MGNELNADELIPWIEKYRPSKLSEVVGQEEIIKRLQSYVKLGNMPHLLFSGSAGTGKTSSALALAKEIYGNQYQRNFLELNASDARGIEVIRSTIKEFARTLAFDSHYKIIFLDESDALTQDAQQALRRTMERYTKTCRFILSVNFSSKILEPIQSRCVVFRFKPLNAKQVEARLKEIAIKEKINLSEEAIKAIEYVCQGDMRKAVNVLQASSNIEETISEKTVYNIASRARPAEIKELINLALNKKFLEARAKLETLLYDYGMSGEDVILQLYRELIDMPENEVDAKTKIELVDIIGEYDFRVVEGANERIQLEALIAQFMKFR